ncbi:MAG: GNAT family N-acetyltransferase [Desulfobacteraceae bacterium]|jgi:ribosomal protein S18 acetylase RimI-like enzyme|nr:MAG: GNAT family N-acetyltransferase [Desulfobacteraceae bacterium]
MNDSLANLIIRPIRLEDTQEINRIQASITKEPSTTDFRRIIEKQLQRGESASFVAEMEGKVAGFMISYIVYGGYGLEKSAWIATLGVDPRWMGQGIGKRLAQEILSFYEKNGIRYIFTSVRWDSADLLSFFKTLGFDRSSFINLRKELVRT